MKNFKKFAFLILIISMMFMAGSVSAVNVEDNFTSENSIDDLSVVPDESRDIVESDVLSSDAVEPTGASDTFDGDELGIDSAESAGICDAFDGDKVSAGDTPFIDFNITTNENVGVYRQLVKWTLTIRVGYAPSGTFEDVNFKMDVDGLKLISCNDRNYYYGSSSFDPNTGILHFDSLVSSSGISYIYMDLVTEVERVGNVSLSVELNYGNSEEETITRNLPTKLGEVDLRLGKSADPFPEVYHTTAIVQSPGLLGENMPSETDYLWDKDDKINYYAEGDIVTWYIRLVNLGPDDAFDVNITDALPDGLIYQSFTAKTDCSSQIVSGAYLDIHNNYLRPKFEDTVSYDEENNVFHIPRINATEMVDIVIVTKANKTGFITNVAEATSDNPELDPDDNADNDTVLVLSNVTDLVITKSAWTDYDAMKDNANPGGDYNSSAVPVIKIGDTVYWLVVVNNMGNITAENVVVKDVLPEGLEFVKTETDFGSYDNDTNTWTIGSLGFGSIEDGINFPYLFIETIAADAGEFTNLVNVSTTTDEEDLTNNDANASVIVVQDLENVTDVPDDNDTVNETNQTNPDNSTSEVPEDDVVPDERSSSNVTSSSKNSDSLVSKSVGAATGNPVLLALMALFVAAGSIFRRKK